MITVELQNVPELNRTNNATPFFNFQSAIRQIVLDAFDTETNALTYDAEEGFYTRQFTYEEFQAWRENYCSGERQKEFLQVLRNQSVLVLFDGPTLGDDAHEYRAAQAAFGDRVRYYANDNLEGRKRM